MGIFDLYLNKRTEIKDLLSFPGNDLDLNMTLTIMIKLLKLTKIAIFVINGEI